MTRLRNAPRACARHVGGVQMTIRRLAPFLFVGLLAVVIPLFVKGDPPGTAALDALIVPPPQVDYEYTGHIVLTRGDEANTWKDCQGASGTGCAIRVSAETCFVFIANDDVLERKRYSYRMVL